MFLSLWMCGLAQNLALLLSAAAAGVKKSWPPKAKRIVLLARLPDGSGSVCSPCYEASSAFFRIPDRTRGQLGLIASL